MQSIENDTYKLLFENAAIGMAVLNDSLKFMNVNNAMLSVLGYSKEEMMGITCPQITHPEDLPDNSKQFAKLKNGQSESMFIRKRYKCKNGDYIWTRFSLSKGEIIEGKQYYIGVIDDIDELVRTEQSLAINKERYALATELSSLGILDWDLKKDEIFFSPKWSMLLGLAPAELNNELKSLTHLIHDDDRDNFLNSIRTYIKRPDGIFDSEFMIKHKSGNYIRVHLLCSVMLDENGNANRLFGILRDCTDAYESKHALLASEKKFRSLFEGAKDMILFTDSLGIITDVNNEFLNKLGFIKDDILGLSIFEYLHPQSKEAYKDVLKNLQEGKSENKYAIKLIGKEGKLVRAEVSSVPEMEDDRMIGTFSFMRDVSKQRQNALELNRMNKQLIEKNRELEQIVYVTSHDLRSPLVNIQGFNQELEISLQDLKKLLNSINIPTEHKHELNILLDQEIPESIEYIYLGIVKMDRLLKGLLTISRMGRRPLEISSLDMNKFISGIVKNFEFQIKENAIVVEIGDLPPCRADESQLNQAFSNLIDNSIKYLRKDIPGKITVTGFVQGNIVKYTICDNGIGIPQEKREKVFEIFYRDEQEKSGEGLGLTLVRKIIEKHLGDVSIEANEDHGISIIISLPK